LAAFGRHLRRGKKIDTFFLAEPPKDDLELRIGKNTSQTKNSRSHRTRAQRWKQAGGQCIRGDGGAAAAVSTSNGAARCTVARNRGSWTTSRIPVRVQKREITRSHIRITARSKGLAAHMEGTEQPIETEFLQIGLSN